MLISKQPQLATQHTRDDAMRSVRLGIHQKGLILLCVPLLFETVVAVSLIYLQHYYASSVKAEVLTKQIVFHINDFLFYSTQLSTGGLGKVFIKDFHVDWTTDSKALSEYQSVKTLLAEDPQQQQRLGDIIACYNKVRDLLGELTSGPRDAPGQLAQVLALKNNLRACKGLMAGNIELGDLINS